MGDRPRRQVEAGLSGNSTQELAGAGGDPTEKYRPRQGRAGEMEGRRATTPILLRARSGNPARARSPMWRELPIAKSRRLGSEENGDDSAPGSTNLVETSEESSSHFALRSILRRSSAATTNVSVDDRETMSRFWRLVFHSVTCSESHSET